MRQGGRLAAAVSLAVLVALQVACGNAGEGAGAANVDAAAGGEGAPANADAAAGGKGVQVAYWSCSVDGCEVWQTDAATGASRRLAVREPFHPQHPGVVAEMAVAGDVLYFSDGDELWRLDRGAGEPELVLDIDSGWNAGPYGAGKRIRDLTVVGEELWFLQDNSLWRSDGTAAGTRDVFTPDVVNDGYGPRNLTFAADRLYFHFEARDASPSGRTLWVADPESGDVSQVDGEVAVRDTRLAPLAGGVAFVGKRPVNNSSPECTGDEPMLARPQRTLLLGDVNTQPCGAGGNPGSEPWALTPVYDAVCFTAVDADEKRRAWITWGESGDLQPFDELDGTLARVFAGAADHLFVVTAEEGSRALWSAADRGEDELRELRGFTDVGEVVAAGSRLFLLARDGEGWALWTSDGSARGTTRLAAVPEWDGKPRAEGLTAAGDGRVVFGVRPAYDDDADGLWASDGTAAGTRLVAGAPFPQGTTRETVVVLPAGW